jgi:SAM-dependent methyltransferase
MELEQLYRERDKPPDEDLWRWSPLEIAEFDRMLKVARDLAVAVSVRLRGANGGLRRLSFAEAGCGIGTKLYLAQNYYDLNAVGFEIDDYYLSRCRELEVTADKWDLRDEDQPPWAAYDIVYLSRPFKDDVAESRWENSVIGAMRTGAVLMSAYAAIKPYSWPCYYRRPFRGVWLKDPEGRYAR